ncbi:unnamed protein product, partial [Rotaria sp. Silwood1]
MYHGGQGAIGDRP